MDLDRLQARRNLVELWRELRAAVGDPSLEPARLADTLEADLPRLDAATTIDTILDGSPELRFAALGVERARLALERERAERVPNVEVSAGLLDDREPIAPGGPSKGSQWQGDVGVRIPLFDRNQGNIAAAEAELERAEAEGRRGAAQDRSALRPGVRRLRAGVRSRRAAIATASSPGRDRPTSSIAPVTSRWPPRTRRCCSPNALTSRPSRATWTRSGACGSRSCSCAGCCCRRSPRRGSSTMPCCGERRSRWRGDRPQRRSGVRDDGLAREPDLPPARGRRPTVSAAPGAATSSARTPRAISPRRPRRDCRARHPRRARRPRYESGTARRQRRRRPRARCGPARCTPRSCATVPGSCPICGMALEPRTPTLDDGKNPELLDMTRRFRLAVRLTVLVVFAAMGDMIPGVPLAYIAPPRFWVWFQLVLSIPIVLWCGCTVLRARLGVDRAAPAQHVHPDRARRGRGLGVQPDRDPPARPLPGLVPRRERAGGRLLRGGDGDRDVGAGRPGARAARPRAHRRRDPLPAQAHAQDGAPAQAGRLGGGPRRSPRCARAIRCACGPARTCRSTAS